MQYMIFHFDKHQILSQPSRYDVHIINKQFYWFLWRCNLFPEFWNSKQVKGWNIILNFPSDLHENITMDRLSKWLAGWVDGETRIRVLYERHNEPEALSLPYVVYISRHKPAINAKGIGTSSTTSRSARQCTTVTLMKSGSPSLSIRHLATTAPASALEFH